MAGLMIQGDPGGWSDVGGSLGALAARLETGLSDADAFGAQALARSWYGPAAAAFSAHWAGRRPRYEDLIVLVRRASRAILAYAHTLEDMRARAANLESVWCGVGLHVLYSGEGFMLPPGLESMPPHAQVSLRQALSESARDVEFLARRLRRRGRRARGRARLGHRRARGVRSSRTRLSSAESAPNSSGNRRT